MSNTRSRTTFPFPLIVVDFMPAPMMVRSSLISRSPFAAASSKSPGIVSVYVPDGRMIVSGLKRAFVSWIAARKVQTLLPAAVSQTPLPGLASTASSRLLTVTVIGADGVLVTDEVGVGVRVFVAVGVFVGVKVFVGVRVLVGVLVGVEVGTGA